MRLKVKLMLWTAVWVLIGIVMIVAIEVCGAGRTY
jgi:hypothetical protein